MSRLGADVDGLESVAVDLQRAAARVDQVRSAVQAQLSRTRWVGPDADAFRGQWRRVSHGDLQGLGQALQAAAEELRRQAAQQRAASGDGAVRGTAVALLGTTGTGAAVSAASLLQPAGAGGLLQPAGSAGLVQSAGQPPRGPWSSGLRSPHDLLGMLVSVGASIGTLVTVPLTPILIGGAVGLVTGGIGGAIVGAYLGGMYGRQGGSAPSSGSAGSAGSGAGAGAGRAAGGPSSEVTEPAAGISPGQPGATHGALPARSPEESRAAYLASGGSHLPAWHAPGGDAQGHCTAWANFRWAELSEEYRSPGQYVEGHGGAMAGNAGGQPDTDPRLGAMLSHSVTGTYAAYGHFAIVEAVTQRDDGSARVTVSGMNYDSGRGQVSASELTRAADGTWTDDNGSLLRDVVVANLP